MTAPSTTIGDYVLQQFIRDWEQLAHELHQLENQKRVATTGRANPAALKNVEARIAKLTATFDRQRELFKGLFASPEWDKHPDVQRLRRSLADISTTINRLLEGGLPGVREESLAELVAEAQKKAQFLELAAKATVGAKPVPTISLPEVPTMPAANLILAAAILIDVARRVFTDKKLGR